MNTQLHHIRIIPISVSGIPVEAQFNPTEVSFTKNVQYDVKQANGLDSGAAEFKNGDSVEFSLSLLFDKTEEQGDVRGVVRNLMRMTMIQDPSSMDPKLKRPPIVTVTWGAAGSCFLLPDGFEGVITSIDVDYKQFTEAGVPCKAVVAIQLVQTKLFDESEGGEGGGKSSVSQGKGQITCNGTSGPNIQ